MSSEAHLSPLRGTALLVVAPCALDRQTQQRTGDQGFPLLFFLTHPPTETLPEGSLQEGRRQWQRPSHRGLDSFNRCHDLHKPRVVCCGRGFMPQQRHPQTAHTKAECSWAVRDSESGCVEPTAAGPLSQFGNMTGISSLSSRKLEFHSSAYGGPEPALLPHVSTVPSTRPTLTSPRTPGSQHTHMHTNSTHTHTLHTHTIHKLTAVYSHSRSPTFTGNTHTQWGCGERPSELWNTKEEERVKAIPVSAEVPFIQALSTQTNWLPGTVQGQRALLTDNSSCSLLRYHFFGGQFSSRQAV